MLQSTSIAAIISMDDDKESEMKRLLEAAGVGGHMSLIIGAGVDDSAWLASCDDDGLNEVTDLLKGAGMPGGHALKLKLYIKGLRRAEESKPKVPLFGKVGTVLSSEPVATQIEAGMCGADPAGFKLMFQPVVSTCCFNLLFQPVVSACCFNQSFQPVVSTCCFNLLFHPVVSTC